MTDSSEIGRFGTLRLLKRHDPTTTIAFFPIDDEEVSFGRNSKCSVRLYYEYVSEIHCILRISEERKAFLVVKGANGVTIDGCEVLPVQSQEATVPLANGSEIEIHKKKFKFEYPPKEIRAALLSTPRTAKSRRSLRMSMIASAQVFSPRKNSPLKTPLRSSHMNDSDQWNVLRSPVKVTSDEQEAVLIEGSGEDAVVVEEEKDLIILEHVEEQNETAIPVSFFDTKASPTPKPITTPSVFPISPRGFKTPPNRRKSGISLHRAVVLRSAHRVHLEVERQRSLEQIQDEEEEEEVELAVSPERDLGPFELHADDNEEIGDDLETVFQDDKEYTKDNEELGSESESESEEEQEEQEERNVEEAAKSDAIQCSQYITRPLETLKAGFNMVEKLSLEKPPEPILEGNGNMPDRSPSPVRRTLKNAFMTPQVASRPAQRIPVDFKSRQTLSGGELLPSLFGGARRVPVEPVREFISEVAETDSADSQTIQAKPRITLEEREAIIQRRRSALQTPTMLPPPAPRNYTVDDEDYVPGREKEDAETMLKRMKVKLETVRRKSEARMARISHVSPQKMFSGYPIVDSSSSPNVGKSRTLRMAEESLKQLKLEDAEDKVVAITPIEAHKSRSEFNAAPVLSRAEPRTPSLLGVRQMFNNHPSTPQTPSFVGLKDMYRITSVKTTPDMKLDEVFDEMEERKFDPEVGQCDLSSNMEIEDHVKPSIVKPASRLPSRKGLRRKAPVETPIVPEIIDVDAPSTKHIMRKITEPLSEVHNNSEYHGDPTKPQADPAAEPRRVTRSRNVRLTPEEPERMANEPTKRATRQTKKQQSEQLNTAIQDESGRTRRARTKQPVVQIKKEEDGAVTGLRSTNRRRTRVK